MLERRNGLKAKRRNPRDEPFGKKQKLNRGASTHVVTTDSRHSRRAALGFAGKARCQKIPLIFIDITSYAAVLHRAFLLIATFGPTRS
jgi:hypothetical protein